jgi:hypothetical protein
MQSGRNAFHAACSSGLVELVKLFLEVCGNDVLMTVCDGNVSIMIRVHIYIHTYIHIYIYIYIYMRYNKCVENLAGKRERERIIFITHLKLLQPKTTISNDLERP